jgi:hypothetical protein
MWTFPVARDPPAWWHNTQVVRTILPCTQHIMYRTGSVAKRLLRKANTNETSATRNKIDEAIFLMGVRIEFENEERPNKWQVMIFQFGIKNWGRI